MSPRPTVWRKRFAVPSEHGTWSWWVGPLVVGIAAGGHPNVKLVPLVVAAFAAFLLHQPAQIAVKALAGRRPRTDLAPALFWVGVYGAVAALGAACLVATGYERVLGLAAPGLLVFGWHLVLVSRKAERRQMGVEVLAAGVLALAAPAAYWVAGGTAYPEPWALWGLTWIHGAAAIANVYLKLEQRRWSEVPGIAARLGAARLTLLLHTAGIALGVSCVAADLAPPLVPLAFVPPWLDALHGALRPPIGARPVQIGLRQLAVSTVFTAGMVVAYLQSA